MLDIHGIMRKLACRRPVFHSEADFQHELAWMLRRDIGAKPRLEYPIGYKEKNGRKTRIYLDIWLPKEKIAIELKYPTRHLQGKDSKGEPFDLRDHARLPQIRFDFLEDIRRIEQATELCQLDVETGYAILLTNDSALWHSPGKEDIVDEKYRLHNREVEGKIKLTWGPKQPSDATKGGREFIYLENSYSLRWCEYPIQSSLKVDNGKTHTQFQYLAVSV